MTRMTDQLAANQKIPAGCLVVFTTGDCDTYAIEGVFRADKEIDVAAQLKAYLTANPAQRTAYDFEDKKFLAYLVKQGWIKPVEVVEWHLSDYSCLTFSTGVHDLTNSSDQLI